MVRVIPVVEETFTQFFTCFTQVLLAIEWRPYSIFVSEHQTKMAPAVIPPLPPSPPYRPPPEPPLPDIYRPPSVPALSRNQVQRNPPARKPAAALHSQPLSDEALHSSASNNKAVAIVQLRVIDADGLSTSRCGGNAVYLLVSSPSQITSANTNSTRPTTRSTAR
jgi:hypothetical protein